MNDSSKLEVTCNFNNFVRNLRIRNRHFMTSGPIDKEITAFVEDKKYYVPIGKGDFFYRAHVCTPQDCGDLKLQERWVVNGIFDPRHEPPRMDKMEGPFAGFPKDKCGAPEAALCGENRASGKGIKRLYVTENAYTAVAETKPSLGSVVSIEKQENQSCFLALNLTESKADDERDFLRNLINWQFSLACSGDSETYSFTQWFSDLVESLGYKIGNYATGEFGRGIKYSSAMHSGGKNLVVFGKYMDSRAEHPLFKEYTSEEYFDFIPVGSEVCYIKDVEYSLKHLKPEREGLLDLKNPTAIP